MIRLTDYEKKLRQAEADSIESAGSVFSSDQTETKARNDYRRDLRRWIRFRQRARRPWGS